MRLWGEAHERNEADRDCFSGDRASSGPYLRPNHASVNIIAMQRKKIPNEVGSQGRAIKRRPVRVTAPVRRLLLQHGQTARVLRISLPQNGHLFVMTMALVSRAQP